MDGSSERCISPSRTCHSRGFLFHNILTSRETSMFFWLVGRSVGRGGIPVLVLVVVPRRRSRSDLPISRVAKMAIVLCKQSGASAYIPPDSNPHTAPATRFRLTGKGLTALSYLEASSNNSSQPAINKEHHLLDRHLASRQEKHPIKGRAFPPEPGSEVSHNQTTNTRASVANRHPDNHTIPSKPRPDTNAHNSTMVYSWNAAPHLSPPVGLRRVLPGPHHARGSHSTIY